MHEYKYISETSLKYRKEFGQYFTPKNIAHLMCSWILKENPKTILDPAFGLGIFYDTVKELIGTKTFHFKGYEIDPNVTSYLNMGRMKNLQLEVSDYLESDSEKYDAIICNPPYMRFQNFLKRHNVLPIIEQKIGRRLLGYSNISSVFLAKAINELNKDGRLTFIMPFEFFNTGYGKDIKRFLTENGLLKQIILFSNEKEIFPDATTTICILFCRNDHVVEPIKVTKINNREEIDSVTSIEDLFQYQIDPEELPYSKKWTSIINALYEQHELPASFCNLAIYGKFVRGIATGANSFFALNKSTINKLDIGNNNFCKCITKSPQIKKLVFTEKDFEDLLEKNIPVFCLDIKDHYRKEVVSYVKYGESCGYHKRFLTKNRIPWYKIEKRNPAPILAGVFNRGRLKVIRNLTGAINFTCFHSFYPNLFGNQYINRLFIYFISDIGQKIMMTNKRKYGGNLDKFEPGDLNECLCPNMEQLNTITEKEAEAVICTAKFNETLAIKQCNKLMEHILASEPSVSMSQNHKKAALTLTAAV